jgi:hypothetical protein
MTGTITNGELKQIQISIAKMEERLNGWMINTDEYRKSRDKIFDHINLTLEKLPCSERRVKFDSHATQLRWIWAILFAVIPAIIAGGVVWGSVQATVERNTEIIKDLQTKSYGYRDIPVLVDKTKTHETVY